VQISILTQVVIGGRIKATAAFWLDGVPITEVPLLVQDFDFPRITSETRRVEDSAGRWITQSGKAVLPVVEVDGEWRPRPDDPADPFRTETVAVNATTRARQMALAWAELEAARRRR
jgi:hypothetical protein